MIHMYIRWYERRPDFSPDYSKEHHGTIIGETPDDCMQKLSDFREHHDLKKYTRTEIVCIY